jgi:citrate synthase
VATKLETQIAKMQDELELNRQSVTFTDALAEKYKKEKILPSYQEDTEVMRGLRYPNGTGVVAGVTAIGDVSGYEIREDVKIPCEGKLYYRGYEIQDLIRDCQARKSFGFEEVVYLLLFGDLPTKDALEQFRGLLAKWSKLPANFTEDVILRFPDPNIMTKLENCIIALHSYDGYAEDLSLEQELYKSFRMVARTPIIVAHSYAAKRHYFEKDSLVLHEPRPDYSVAENFLYTLRRNQEFSEEEARLLDLCMILHAEHGGGNNSTFACRVLTSSGTDFYSAIAGAAGSLKGYRHGGANIKVSQMFRTIKEEVQDWDNDRQVRDCLLRIVRKQTGDGSGLIYGMGHAVYTLSDPRAKILKEFSRNLAREKGMEAELNLIESVERQAPEVFREEKGSTKQICANVDLYSGFVYRMLGIPEDIFTPLFAASRMPGWCAHRIEECCSPDARIIRPAYRNVGEKKAFLTEAERGL